MFKLCVTLFILFNLFVFSWKNNFLVPTNFEYCYIALLSFCINRTPIKISYVLKKKIINISFPFFFNAIDNLKLLLTIPSILSFIATSDSGGGRITENQREKRRQIFPFMLWSRFAWSTSSPEQSVGFWVLTRTEAFRSLSISSNRMGDFNTCFSDYV